MVIDTTSTIPKVFHSNWIQRTRNRFYEACLAITVGTLQGTKTTTILITSEDTVLTTNDTRHQIAFFIGVSDTLFIYDCLSRSWQITPNSIKDILYLHCLVQGYRCTSISLNAALTMTFIKVAAELHIDYIWWDKHVTHHKYMIIRITHLS